jgi:hypothetical protein
MGREPGENKIMETKAGEAFKMSLESNVEKKLSKIRTKSLLGLMT